MQFRNSVIADKLFHVQKKKGIEPARVYEKSQTNFESQNLNEFKTLKQLNNVGIVV